MSLLLEQFLATLLDVGPIVAVIFAFQYLVLRQRIPRLPEMLIGLIYVVLGLALFLMGLEMSLFGIGEQMAAQLVAHARALNDGLLAWWDYGWVYAFAFAIGFATAAAEPALIAVALKAQEQSGGAYNAFGLRMTVALGVAIGLTLGVFRIITGTPLHYYIMAGYVIVVVQTLLAPRAIVPLAYDSGGVATSTVTVPVVAALGLELAASIPGRSPLVDGFGLIAFACLFPIMTVMAYAQVGEWLARRRLRVQTTERKRR